MLIKLAREQMILVRWTLKSASSTIDDVSNSELIIGRGLRDIEKFINDQNGEISQKYEHTSMLISLNNHAIQIQTALEEVRNEYDVIMQSCLRAEKEVLQPQIISPNRMIQMLKSSQDSFPTTLEIRIQLSFAYSHMLINIISIRVYMLDSTLVYVVGVPLVTHHIHDVYKILPFPSRNDEASAKYDVIQPEREYIFIDNTK
jgi:hypothetical protein